MGQTEIEGPFPPPQGSEEEVCVIVYSDTWNLDILLKPKEVKHEVCMYVSLCAHAHVRSLCMYNFCSGKF